jgi:hypothetical protein
MATVKRYDRGDVRMDGAVRTQQGFLRVPARITRTGVFTYRKADGTLYRELRLPEEVFNADALASFSLAPLTLEHPPEPVTADNVDKYRVGTAGELVRQDGEFVATTVVVENADAIRAVEQGKRELSCGYECELDESPGVTPAGERYDAIQRAIRGNHVAIVAKGRAGPDARLRMDANDAEQVPEGTTHDNPNKQEKHDMRKIKIDGVEYEVSETAAQAIEKRDATHAAQLAELQAKVDSATARADAADDKAGKAQAALAEAPAKVRAELRARTELEAKATKVLGAEQKYDGMTDAQIKAAVLAKAAPSLKLDGKSEAYVDARFDAAIESTETAGTEQPVIVKLHGDGAIVTGDSEAKARAAMIERNRGMHKTGMPAAE